MIFQHFNLVRRKSVLVNVLSGRLADTGTWASVTGRFSEEDRRRALECLELVGLGEKAKQRADELSGGQQQRVAIARTLLQDPEILLADEPVASLDPATSHSVMRYLRDANQKLGKTILCNLHFLSLVRAYGTRVIALKDGELVFEGSPDRIDEAWFKRIYGEDAIEVRID
jgi:phosphonate transport system ATP-binding protein